MAEAMHRTLEEAKGDDRVPPTFLAQMRGIWEEGMRYAQ